MRLRKRVSSSVRVRLRVSAEYSAAMFLTIFRGIEDRGADPGFDKNR
jgi:hypothetical protein